MTHFVRKSIHDAIDEAKLIYILYMSVRISVNPQLIDLIVNLGMLELYYFDCKLFMITRLQIRYI